jgi:hypothetical protein
MRIRSLLLAWCIAVGLVGQGYLINEHLSCHFAQKIETAQGAVPVIQSDVCPICDGVMLAPEAPRMVFSLEVAPLVRPVPPVPPVFLSDNAILLPFGARGPPFRAA